jgi:dTDP-4-amino-4,6-dideoxygalactose transaminase
VDIILQKVKEVVINNDFTLGKAVDYFEEKFAELIGAKYAVGVGSGTDAIFLSLRAIDIKPGDEVITTAFTFYATVGAIVTAGAKPVFCDVGEDFNIDVSKIRSLITKDTKAIVPVHWSGRPCDMEELLRIAKEFNLHIIEDACHSISAEYNGKKTGTFGLTGCFSFHPLKNLNVWGDGGIVTTNSREMYVKLKLLRNHGLSDRDNCEIFAYNSRLDTIQAVIATHMLDKIEHITSSRIENAKTLDNLLSKIPEIKVTNRSVHVKEVFHIYSFLAEERDLLLSFLQNNGIDAKVHYPIPMHLQKAAEIYGYKKGDLPNSERITDMTISLPVHEFITKSDIDFMVSKIRDFYESR